MSQNCGVQTNGIGSAKSLTWQLESAQRHRARQGRDSVNCGPSPADAHYFSIIRQHDAERPIGFDRVAHLFAKIRLRPSLRDRWKDGYVTRSFL
jgi:hypothetical protein